MNRAELSIALCKTDAVDRDILERLITGYFRRPNGTKRIASSFGMDPHDVFARLERLRELGLVSVIKNANYDPETKKYDGDIPGSTVGWIYSGGPISEFFELILLINFA